MNVNGELIETIFDAKDCTIVNCITTFPDLKI